MLSILSQLLRERADAIDAGNSRISEEQENLIIDLMTRMSNPKEKLSKAQALKYLKDHNIKISRATFDNYVKEGKIPEGRHELGFNPKF
jgi:hypothetical protein